MTPLDILERLAAEGLSVTLKLRLDGDSEPTLSLERLIVNHRADLIIYFAMQHSDTPQMCRLSEAKVEGPCGVGAATATTCALAFLPINAMDRPRSNCEIEKPAWDDERLAVRVPAENYELRESL